MAEDSRKRRAEKPSPRGRRSVASDKSEPVNAIGYVVDLFLDNQQQVLRTQILHVGKAEGDSWEGWDGSRLLAFMAEHAGIQEVAETLLSPPSPNPVAAEAPPRHRPILELQGIESAGTSGGVAAGQPIKVWLPYDIRNAGSQKAIAAPFRLALIAGNLQTGEKTPISVTSGTLTSLQESIVVSTDKTTLHPGFYRLQATLQVRLDGADLTSSRSGMLLIR